MTNKELVLEVLNKLGITEAENLQEKFSEMTDTEIIDNERAVPDWSHDKDYSSSPVGTPVSDEDQIWKLITPHRASDYDGRPSTLRALWGLMHTKNPLKAKAWVDSYGTSGMYMKDECYLHENGHVYKCLEDNVVYSYDAYPGYWEDLGTLEELKETSK